MEKILDYLKANNDNGNICEFDIHHLAKELNISEDEIRKALYQLVTDLRINIIGTDTFKDTNPKAFKELNPLNGKFKVEVL